MRPARLDLGQSGACASARASAGTVTAPLKVPVDVETSSEVSTVSTYTSIASASAK
jgi:hypothetical protein